jgi:hypothetical protein
MVILIILVLVFVFWIGTRIYKGAKNSKPTFDDHHFKQGDVEVEFATGKIRIRNYTYNVNQVTGISSRPFMQNRHGNSRAWKAIIEIDDFKKPSHTIEFFSLKSANEFTQRLSTALRKAGGPSFN